MAKGKAIYKSYLLRVWWEAANGTCRIRLEPVDKEPLVLHFADLDHLFEYLLATARTHDSAAEEDDRIGK